MPLSLIAVQSTIGRMDQGETCCPNRVARLAKKVGIKAQNYLYKTYEGVAYLAVVIDLYSRQVLEWALSVVVLQSPAGQMR